MKKAIFYLIIIILVVWGLQNYSSFKPLDLAKTYWDRTNWSKEQTPDPEKQLNIFIRDSKFIPNLNSVQAGAKVTWFNEDNKNHTVTGESWGSEEIAPGKAWSKTFDVTGDYKYHCLLHPSMTGEIIVR